MYLSHSFVHSPVFGYVDRFHSLVLKTSEVVNTYVQMSLRQAALEVFGCIYKNGRVGALFLGKTISPALSRLRLHGSSSHIPLSTLVCVLSLFNACLGSHVGKAVWVPLLTLLRVRASQQNSVSLVLTIFPPPLLNIVYLLHFLICRIT